MKASVKSQLGPLLHQHRPSALWKGWLFVIAISWWPILGWFTPQNEAPIWFLVLFSTGLFTGFALAFSEWAFGVDRLYTHALVVTVSFPFSRSRVIPLRTINPSSITVQYVPLNVYPQGVRWTVGLPIEGPAQRGHPFARWAVTFTGTSAAMAREHARARTEVRDDAGGISSRWLLADSNNRDDADLHADQLRHAIATEPPTHA